MAITFSTDMKYTRAGEGDESDVLSAHNPLIWEFADGAIAATPTATVDIVVKNNAGSTIFTSDTFAAYLLSYSAPTANFRFDATQIIKHIINNYFYKETSDVIEAENYGSEIEVTFKSYDNAVLEDTELLEYFASHALNQIGNEYGSNIPRMFYNDTEEIAHFLGFPNHLFFYNDTDLVAETPITEILPAVANLITAWTNSIYDTFTSTGSEITSAISTGPGGGIAISNEFSIQAGQFIRLVFNLTLNSDEAPSLLLFDIATSSASLIVKSANGDNTIVLESPFTTTQCVVQIRNTGADADTNFSTDAIHAQLLHAYSEEGTFAIFVHDLNLGLFQLNALTKHALVKYDPTDPTLIKTWNLTIFQPCENAVYIRFLTKDGYYMYWAFSPFPSTNESGQDIGNVINSFAEMALANSRHFPIGKKNAFKKLDVAAASVPIVFRRKLMDLFSSPAVYLWQGSETPDENLLTTWSNQSYDTFESDGTVIISAIEAATASALSGSVDNFDVVVGERISVILFLTLNSGQVPSLSLLNASGLAVISNIQALAAGANIITLTVTETATARLRISNSAATDFSTGKVIIKRAEVETDWLLLEAVEGSHDLREKKQADNFRATLVYPEKYTQQLSGQNL